MLRWKDLKFIAENMNKNKAKFKFQGQSAWSQRWFGIDSDCIEVNLAQLRLISIRKFQSNDDTQDTNTFKSFQVPIGISKCVETFKFHNDAPIFKYCQKSFNKCCFSSLESAFVSIKNNQGCQCYTIAHRWTLEE